VVAGIVVPAKVAGSSSLCTVSNWPSVAVAGAASVFVFTPAVAVKRKWLTFTGMAGAAAAVIVLGTLAQAPFICKRERGGLTPMPTFWAMATLVANSKTVNNVLWNI
jgi:hypothetical protein